ncbi:MAG: hypothetical protein J2O47_00070 [Acidimicrobiaceae bacterium]|nr:hypothetical protein [Acidimicrobiaceae bacterium]
MISAARSTLPLRWLAAPALVLAVVLAGPAAARADAPAFKVSVVAQPTNLPPNTAANFSHIPEYEIVATNVGAAQTNGAVTITDTLPAGLTPNGPSSLRGAGGIFEFGSCTISGQTVSCTIQGPVSPGQWVNVAIPFDVGPLPEGSTVNDQATVSGGGAGAVQASTSTTISSADAPFGLLDGSHGINGTATDADGLPLTQAGSHPYQVTLDFLPATVRTADGTLVAAAGGVRDLRTDLPRGMVVDPNATPVRCTEAELESVPGGGCPLDSQVGLVSVVTPSIGTFPNTTPLFNMVPTPDAPALLGFDAIGIGIYTHIKGGVRAGDYALTADTRDILSRSLNPVVGIQAQLWGDPSADSHGMVRGPSCTLTSLCTFPGQTVAHRTTPFLTMPTACSPSLEIGAHLDSWVDPGTVVDRFGTIDDVNGDPTPVTGCQQLDFDPSIVLQPTTQAADSSSGMDVDLQIPQPNAVNTLAEANLKKAVVTLPVGMGLNPSASDGLAGCTEAQIGLTSEAPVPQFDNSPSTCPDGSVVGDATIETPLLPDPLHGTLYLADPNDNPFHSLLSGYLVAQGQGVTLKIPGRFDRDPQTGQITAVFDNNPQLPFSDLKLHFKGGDRGVIVTPPECGTYTINSDLVPWSAADPNNPAPSEIVHRSNTFDVTSGPGGGPCPDLTDPARFTPGFTAGTVSPAAGQYSPFVLKVSRPDGQQSLKQIHLDLPPGLVAKLADVPRCSQAQITPGIDGSTNCPAGSQIGTVNVGAGAGSTPFFLQNQPVYLTDGYNGAPYGIVIDTHALAGPFDLGHVVVRSTLNVDKDDAQVHVDSENLPWIIQGIPLHIRSISVNVNKPGFILNPTNCNPMQVTGTVTGGGEDFDDPADDTAKPVSDRFQVGGCGGLGFSPSLSGAILNGSQGIHRSDHPNLRFHLAPTPGDANLASVAVTLPPSLQIDQANLGNICSETQLATQECAGRNTVGTASATTPLLGSTLSGPVYAVSGSGGLPKLAVILNGPAADPVHLLVRGITTTVGARIANTFPLVPDTPVTSFDLTLNGGPAGYLVNNTNVCGKAKGRSKKAKKKAMRLRKTNLTADALFTAQDGDTLSQRVPISAQCPKAKKPRKAKRHARRNR